MTATTGDDIAPANTGTLGCEESFLRSPAIPQTHRWERDPVRRQCANSSTAHALTRAAVEPVITTLSDAPKTTPIMNRLSIPAQIAPPDITAVPTNKIPASPAIRRAGSNRPDEDAAVAELSSRLGATELKSAIIFCAPTYDLTKLGRAIRSQFPCPVIGCTTAGELLADGGYREGGLTAVGFTSESLSFTPRMIPSLSEFLSDPAPGTLAIEPTLPGHHQFALMLIDGLSMLEERIAAAVNQRLQGIPLIGGSAGDGLSFAQTHIYWDGEFRRNAAVVALFSTALPFKTFRIQHLVPTEIKFVITEADVATRTVFEINGLPAAEEYARIVGLRVDQLSPAVFSANSVMLRIGGEYYVRSIKTANPDGSLTFFCAIDAGLVLTLARPGNLKESLQSEFARLDETMPGLQLILGCDCIMRRLELAQQDGFEAVNRILEKYPFVGFSTYGEQVGGIHVNQTLTGIAVGGLHE